MDDLHYVAREVAARLTDPDKKQLRFNEIVKCGLDFYPADPRGGVVELVQSCSRTVKTRDGEEPNPLYVSGSPMWRVLRDQYKWMLFPS